MSSQPAPLEQSVLEAVDTLSHMTELDVLLPEEEGLSEAQVSQRIYLQSWHDPAYYAYHREKIRETLATLLRYMKRLYDKEKGYLREEHVQQGVQALMLLVAEAAQKIDRFTAIFKGETGERAVSELKEFKELQQFYVTRVVQKFQTTGDVGDPWREEWGVTPASTHVLQDLDQVRHDETYELFLNRREDGSPYFERPLLRHIQLIGRLDAALSDLIGQDLFLRVQMISDKEAHVAAKEILHRVAPHMDAFYKEALKYKNIPFVSSINKAMMALMLAGNTRNLMQNAVGKHALKYYTDFHAYLRSALQSPEYRSLLEGSPPDNFLHLVLNLTHRLCDAFFLKMGFHKEMMGFIYMLIEKGGQGSPARSPGTVWNALRERDEDIRRALKQHPSGPLLKAVGLLREGNLLQGFDPIAQMNQPSQLYTLSGEEMSVTCLRIPSPTQQQNIASAYVVGEFRGFIRSLQSESWNKHHLLINLQDRTAWAEHARCVALEGLDGALKGSLFVVTLPKQTEFYFQSGRFAEWDDAAEFMKLLKAQVEEGEQCGFYFPDTVSRKELLTFVSKAIQTIHTLFFGGKERLVQKNRQDFIEIFYQFLVLWFIESFKADTISFTCKDAVDTGAAAGAELFAFLRIMSSQAPWTKPEKDILLWMLYAPALSVRGRAIHPQRLERALSACVALSAGLEVHFAKSVAACSKLFKMPFFNSTVNLS